MNKADYIFEKIALSPELLRKASRLAKNDARHLLREEMAIVKHMASLGKRPTKKRAFNKMKGIKERILQGYKFEERADSIEAGRRITEKLRNSLSQKDFSILNNLFKNKKG